MLSSLWNQITTVESDESDDESFPSKPLHEDDILAASLLSTFPAYGTHSHSSHQQNHHQQHHQQQQRKRSTATVTPMESQSPSGSSSVSSIVSGEWEFSPRTKKGKKGSTSMHLSNANNSVNGGGAADKEGGLFLDGIQGLEELIGFSLSKDYDNDSASEGEGARNGSRGGGSRGGSSNVSFTANRPISAGGGMIIPNNHGGDRDNSRNPKMENYPTPSNWTEEDETLWRRKETKRKRSKRRGHGHGHGQGGGRGSRRSGTSQRPIDADLKEVKKYWIHGNNAAPSSTTNTNTTGTGTNNNSSGNGISPTGYSYGYNRMKKHYALDDDITVGTAMDSASSDDETSSMTSASVSTTSQASSKNNNKNTNTNNKSKSKSTSLLKKDHHHDMNNIDEEKSHWMPDALCKNCYSCEDKFTVFRRRHHCRLCGQVFCSRCSSYFLEILGGPRTINSGTADDPQEQGQQQVMRTIRVCKLCYEQVSANGPKGLTWFNNEDDNKVGQDGGGGEKKDGLSNIKGVLDSSSSRSENPTAASSSEQQLQQQQQQMQLPRFQGGSGTSGEFLNLALVKQKLEEERLRREEEEKAAMEEEKDKKKEGMIGGIGGKNHLKSPLKGFSTSITRRFGRLAESAAREAQLGDAGYNDEETKLVGTGVRENEEDDEDDVKSTISSKNNKDLAIVLPSGDEASVKTSAVDGDAKQNNAEKLRAGHRRLGLTAADYLEKVGRELLRTDAPTLLKELGMEDGKGPKFEKWVSKLMMLATKCCTTVKPNVRHGDFLDVRPYCKVKVIPGGKLKDSVFLSGIVFHKNVSHKTMTKEISNPRIMLLSGGIEYTRRENRIASLHTLLEQESKYLQIHVTKITKLKPDILIVGESVSRKAQELLLETKIVLIQQVKPSLMERIARQTGATILSSTDHFMNQFGTNVLGKCRRFRLVSFRDNDRWGVGEKAEESKTEMDKARALVWSGEGKDSVETNLSKMKLSNHQRQAVLAANLLGENVHDGSEAVKAGIVKRGVTQTYVMLEGCPSHLGCTVVLRGTSRAALKEVKRLFHFIVITAYNLRLETSYFKSRCATLPEDFKISCKPAMSTSLCVDYGSPPQGRKLVLPWNGGTDDPSQRSLSGKITPLDHQSILISSVWMAGATLCCPAEVKGICYYSQQDVSLGQFLRDSCFNCSLKCQNQACKKSVLEHSLSFVHNDGLINITVEEMDGPIPSLGKESVKKSSLDSEIKGTGDNKDRIATWTYCMKCRKVVTPLTYIDEDTWNFSFGKFLEVFFYNRTALINAPEHQCNCQVQTESTLYFGCGNLAARFTYEKINPYGVFLRRFLPFDESYHKKFTVLELNEIMMSSSDLFERFNRHIDSVSRETRHLFVLAVYKPENLQTILTELQAIGKEVVHASEILKERIVSVTNRYNSYNKEAESGYSYGDAGKAALDAFSHFPWHARRYLFMLTSTWNLRLSAIGKALTAIRKMANAKSNMNTRSEIVMSQTSDVDTNLDEIIEAMQRVKELSEFYSSLNVSDMNVESSFGGLIDKRILDDEDLDDDEEFNGDSQSNDIKINFSEEIDADVLASRIRRSAKHPSNPRASRRDSVDEESHRRHGNKPPRQRTHTEEKGNHASITSRDSFPSLSSRSQSPSPQQKAKAVSAGGAVKSAFNRFFKRGSEEHDPHIVDLGIFSQGRPKLEPGIDGVVIPVFDDQPSTIIAHSLASSDYESQFKRHMKYYLKEESRIRRGGSSATSGSGSGNGDGSNNYIEDFLAGPGGLESQRSKRDDSRSNRRGRSHNRRNSPVVLPVKVTNTKEDIEKRLLVRSKTHIKDTFRDFDEEGNQIAKFVCTTYWSTQFQAVRQAFLKEGTSDKATAGLTYGKNIIEKNYVRSLSASLSWAASGGKSGASFSRTEDDRFIVKSISRTELQMFLDCAPAYFEYLSKAFFHGLPTMLCKIVGVYEIGHHNRETNKRTVEQVAVMQNIFYGRNISKVFDLKGSLRGRFAKHLAQNKSSKGGGDRDRSSSSPLPKRKSALYGSDSEMSSDEADEEGEVPPYTGVGSDDDEGGAKEDNGGGDAEPSGTLLDGDFLEWTGGRPLPMTDRAKAAFQMSITNDTLFLSIINVLDYSILVGIDESKNELVVGIIDFMRQYDILKQVERVGKSIPMVVGQQAPTIIQPPLYKQRFINAMEKYFMTVPHKWTMI